MIKVNVTRAADGFAESFKIRGHAGFAARGRDIVCSAVTAVAFAAIGYAESLYNPEGDPSLRCYEEHSGFLVWQCPELSDADRQKLIPVLDAMVLGLKQISESAGKQYLLVFD